MRKVLAVLLFSLAAAAQVPMKLNFQYMAVDPANNQNLWGATNTTLYHSIDGGNLFRAVPIAVNAGAATIFALAISPQSGSTLFVIAQYTPSIGLLWRSTDGGQTWSRVDPQGAPSAPAANSRVSFFFNHASPQTVYYQINNQLYKSTDTGTTWKLQQAALPGNPIEVNAGNSNRMYCLLAASALNGSGLAVSNDEGLTWKAAAVPPADNRNGTVKSISGAEVHSNPANPDSVIYAAEIVFQEGATETSGGFVFYSSDGGQSFKAPTGSPTNDFASYYPSADGQIVLNQGLSIDNNLNRSLDFGATWSSVSQSIFQPFAFDPRNSKAVYGSGFQAVSHDAGITWTARNPMYFPVALPISVQQTLEAGTAYISPGGPLLDSEGNNLIVSSPVAAASDSWLSATVQTFPGSETYYSYKISAAGLTPGSYKGQIRVTSSDLTQDWVIAVQLTVVERIAPQLHFISKVVAGTGTSALTGDNGPSAQAAIECCASGLTFDPSGSLYLNSLYRVRRITNGTITTFAGTGKQGNSGDGGAAASASFGALFSMAYTGGGLVVNDALNNLLRIIGADGQIHALYSGPFSVTPNASFLTYLAADTGGNLLVTDGSGIYEWTGSSFSTLYGVPARHPSLALLGITPQNDILTAAAGQLLEFSRTNKSLKALAGTGIAGFGGDHGAAAQAQIAPSAGPVADSKGNVYFADGARVRVLMPSGIVETVAGDGDTVNPLTDGADATGGSLGIVTALAIDAHDNLFVATRNNFIYQLSMEAGPPAPQINPGGVVSLASGAAKISPGEMFSIYGANLAAAKGQSPSIPLLENVNGVTVKVNGKPAPIYYVSGIQINAQLPWDTAEGSATVLVTNNGATSNSVAVQVVGAAPDILQYNGHHAVAIMPNGSLNGPTNPAAAGIFLVIYLTGVGAVDQTVASGAASPSNPPAKVAAVYQVTIDQKKIPVAFLGLAPGFVGLGQMNIQVPPGFSAGDHSLVLTIGGAASNAVFISTK